MSYTGDELLEMEPDELQVLYVNNEITALQFIESQPDENELYGSFLRHTKTCKGEATAVAYLDYENQMANEFKVII